ncbi:MAG TPA: hypothetical protein VLE95_01085 [Chlamydiales bacterium]|nr:hypothetical protein [Chlamydiales bacterium]
MRCFYLFFALSAFATVNEPFRWEIFSGYRNDSLHWHLQTGGSGALNTSAIYRDVQFWENGLNIQTINRDLAFYLCASYGAIGGGGTVFNRYANLPFASNEPEFRFTPNGWTADTSGYFGYAVNLTADRTYKVILIPLFGYSAHVEHIRAKDGHPDPLLSTDAIGADFYTMSASLPGACHLTWYGIFLGAGFKVEPGGRLILSGGYSYHWLHARFRSRYKTNISLFDPNPISREEDAFAFHTKGSGNLGQTGWGQIDYVISKDWRAGFGAQIHYYSTELLNTKLHEKSIFLTPSNPPLSMTFEQKLKIRWTSISGWFMLSRQF